MIPKLAIFAFLLAVFERFIRRNLYNRVNTVITRYSLVFFETLPTRITRSTCLLLLSLWIEAISHNEILKIWFSLFRWQKISNNNLILGSYLRYIEHFLLDVQFSPYLRWFLIEGLRKKKPLKNLFKICLGESKKKRNRKLHHIGFAVYEVPNHMARLTPVYVSEHVRFLYSLTNCQKLTFILQKLIRNYANICVIQTSNKLFCL